MTSTLVDLVCMVYHEARNVRYPIKVGRIADPERFAALLLLSRARAVAWRQMRKVRDAATATTSRTGIAEAFELAYHLSVADLAELYTRPIWKNSVTGGNAWVAITRKIAEALKQHEAGNDAACVVTIRGTLTMRHNTGDVASKLTILHLADAR